MSDEQMTNYGQNGANTSTEKSVGFDLAVFAWEVIKTVLISLAIILPIRYYLVQPFFVKGPSMESNFLNNDYLIVNEIGYRFEDPQRGDVVIFRYPLDTKQFFIKRIVGLPGETVEVRDNSVIIYNKQNPGGLILKEDYLDASQQTLGNSRIRMDDDEYFMMGDNRLMSHDSRAFGPVKKTFIIGRAMLRLYPLNRIGTISRITN
jgi:signal peptidase I